MSSIDKESNMQVKKKLLDIVRDKVRFKHYSLSTDGVPLRVKNVYSLDKTLHLLS